MWKTLVSLLFPKQCVACKTIGNYICDRCFSYIDFDATPICPMCKKRSIEGSTHTYCDTSYSMDGLISAVQYNRVIKRLIHIYKNPPYVSDLTDTIGSLMCESLVQNEKFYQLIAKDPVILPVPLHRKKLNSRGYNHASLLCSYVAQYFTLNKQEDLIVQRNSSKNHRKLRTSESPAYVLDSFSITNVGKQTVKGKTIVVIDDTVVTCSTLREIAKVLKRHGAKEVWGVVVARETYRKYVGRRQNQV